MNWLQIRLFGPYSSSFSTNSYSYYSQKSQNLFSNSQIFASAQIVRQAARFLFIFILFLLLTTVSVNAEGNKEEGMGAPTGKLDLDWKGPAPSPSEELLEFLVSWETPSGEWISPIEVKELEIPEAKGEENHQQ